MMETEGRKRLSILYMWLIAAVGVPVCLYSAIHFPIAIVDFKFIVLVLLTIFLGSRIGVEIPRIGGRITVADTMVFLMILYYGGEAAILLAVAETLCSSLRICKRPIIILFNSSMMAVSTLITIQALRMLFGPTVGLRYVEPNVYIIAVCIMAVVQYFANSGLVAIGAALKTEQPIWQTWRRYYLWTSVTYFAGASVAAVIARVIDSIGYYSIAAVVPIIAIVYFTYQTYLKSIAASEAHARQVEQHVEELSRYIAEQERIREQFSEVEKMSALGQLASGVAHDFNNCLAAILGRAELMSKYNQDPKMKRGLDIIIKSAQDGAKTVKRIQDFARQRRTHDFALLSVDQVLFDVSEITRPRWKDHAEAANVHIDLELLNSSEVLVMGDASELREVMVNMVFNAVDAMPEGGRLTLSAEVEEDSVVLVVGDTGIGMTPEVRSRAFDPFFTTKGVQGMGLGLAVSYGIIRRHDGNITIESEAGRGTTFKIKLPIAAYGTDTQSNAESGVNKVAQFPRANMTKILVVDDEEPVRELMREILEDEGCEVDMASEGYEALALFDGKKFDAVFTDVGMPGMSGWELARAIRERNSKVPLAVITGWGEMVGTTDRESARVDWVLTKPFSMGQINEITEEVTRRRKKSLIEAARMQLIA
jgi:signal transduction histidine kinase/CheY-like chemotaxis protein